MKVSLPLFELDCACMSKSELLFCLQQWKVELKKAVWRHTQEKTLANLTAAQFGKLWFLHRHSFCWRGAHVAIRTIHAGGNENVLLRFPPHVHDISIPHFPEWIARETHLLDSAQKKKKKETPTGLGLGSIFALCFLLSLQNPSRSFFPLFFGLFLSFGRLPPLIFPLPSVRP